MVENKKQHYVPRFYFRLFSKDTTHISIYNLDNKNAFYGPYDTLCYENYFYGKDTEFERTLSPLESKFAEIVKKIIDNKSLNKLELEDYFFLSLFITFQKTRTRRSKEQTERYFENFSENVIKPLMCSDPSFREAGIKREDINKFQIKNKNSHAQTMFTGLTGNSLILDLTPTLLINNTKNDYIFSDNPVILYNQYFNHKKDMGYTGFQSEGLQIFLPLNSKIAILLYDPKYYRIPSGVDSTVEISSEKDIDSINRLQFFNCEKNIFFSDYSNSEYVKLLHQSIGKIETAKTRYIIHRFIDEDPRRSEFLSEYYYFPFYPVIYDNTVNIIIELIAVKAIVQLSLDKFQIREIHHQYKESIDYKLNLTFLEIKKQVFPNPSGIRNRIIISDYDKIIQEIMKEFSKTA